MSAFVVATQGWQHLRANDERLNRPDYRAPALFVDGWNAVAPATFETEWWPRGGNFVGDRSVDVGLLEPYWQARYDPAAGAASRYGFVGVTRDANGTPVGTVTVKLFRTSDDLLLDTTISDPSGNFLLNTAYYPDAHYIVAHKSGSPDIDGVTVNTLIGT